MDSLLQDIDPRLEAFFAKFGAVGQGMLESLPWQEQPAAGNRVMFTAKAYLAHSWWQSWRTQKLKWRRLGFSVAKPGDDWIVTLSLPQTGPAPPRNSGVIPVPDGLAYYDFQKSGIEFLAGQSASLLADEPGLGKTIQVCGLLNACSDIASTLIICPASVKLVWERELKTWLVDSPISIGVVGRSPDALAGDIVIINYDLLGKFRSKLMEREWDLLVLDEAHFIKSLKAQRTKLVLGLRGVIKRKVLLTGTPIMNRPAELWSLLSFLDPVTWGKFFPFARKYCNAHRTPFGWDFDGASNLNELSERLLWSGSFLRRTKAEVLPQLPSVTRQVVPLVVPLNEIVELLTERIAEKLGLAPDDLPFEVDPTKIPFELIAAIRHELGVLKVDAALRFIKEETGDSPEKVVIFGHHRNVLESAHGAFPDSVLVTGSTSAKLRNKAVEAFQGESGPKYFIASTQCMGVGVTLTASSRVIFIEPDWSPSMLEQAESRLCRIGQANAILSQYLVVHRSIDENILAAVRAKRAITDAVLTPNQSARRHTGQCPEMAAEREYQAAETGEQFAEIHH
jgi:SWI/SNF-related matrix-associated actin-dependent regulator of chromatin subfamily A-like protein 1